MGPWGSWIAVGAAAWSVELALCFARGFDLFLRGWERALFALAALWLPAVLAPLGVAASAWLARAEPRARRVAQAAALIAVGAGAAWAGCALTAGRRVRHLPYRVWLVVAFVLVACLAAWLGVRALKIVQRKGAGLRKAVVVALVLLAAALGAIDLWVLPRSYPAFHLGLTASALLVWIAAGATWPEVAVAPRRAVRVVGITLVGALLGMGFLLDSVNAGFATEQAAPWTGKLVRGLGGALSAGAPLAHTSRDMEASPAASQRVQRGIDLKDRDLLLITVDALRADALGAYGGSVGTPSLDALASEGVVFERAYTPTPHTSYALASLLTAKPLREVMGLAGAAEDHVTLPDLLRRYGYRTAAFYPPAIFFVDGSRFGALQERGLGFEYRKKMYASARDRVGQVRHYLQQVPAGKPVFVWVHLFEPHEPYAPPEGEPESDQPQHRYEAEVRYVDAAVGELVAAFRGMRPGASVVVSADHGEEFGDHGGHYHGTTLYDEQVRIPLLWSSPGVVEPGRTQAPVELLDVGTSMLAAAGIPRDARMRGDDLGEVLAGSGTGPRFAFASVDDRYMVTDGRWKAICRMHESRCRLYDVVNDPAERQNAAARAPDEMKRLRAALASHLGSIAREEVAAMAEGVGWPEPLVRARLGAPGVAPDLVPLLSHARAEVRAAAARALGDLRHEGARVVLGRLRQADASARVRDEAAIACCALGEAEGCDAAQAALASPESDVRRRAAAMLARTGRADGAQVLIAWVEDDSAEETERVQAIELLAELGVQDAEPTLIRLLSDVRLRIAAAEALGVIGTRAGADALAEALAEERYPPARHAEAAALVRLKDRRAPVLIRRMLGTGSSLPEGVQLLVAAGDIGARADGAGARFVSGASVLSGSWQCAGEGANEADTSPGCVPAADARVRLVARRRPRGPVRLVVSVRASGQGVLVVDGERAAVSPGESQLVFERPEAPSGFAVQAEGPVRLRAVAVVAQSSDVAPPAPEPWEPGQSAEGAHTQESKP